MATKAENSGSIPTHKADNSNKRYTIYSAILECVSEEHSYLYALRGTPHIVNKIWDLVILYWKETIEVCPKTYDRNPLKQFCLDLDYCRFPEPSDISINMMPFIMAKTFEDTQLPDYLEDYFKLFLPLIEYCPNSSSGIEDPTDNHYLFGQEGKICYLSVQEYCADGTTHGIRPGIRTETPGRVCITNNYLDYSKGQGSLTSQLLDEFPAEWEGWESWWEHNIQDGIFVAINTPNACKVWNCKIPRDSNGREIIGNEGDIEHLRDCLTECECYMMGSSKLHWITDRTPIEYFKVPDGTYVQRFRLFTNKVSVWFEDYSTTNPNGVVPDSKVTKIVKGSTSVEDSLLLNQENG